YVTSPTFTLMNVYDCADGGVLYHFDLYRLRSVRDVIDAGFDEVFDSNGICLIEWADAAQELFRTPPIRVEIRPLGENERDITISFPDERRMETL
ncbi:MAG: tRNA (adenosine(37)-N6)-threonylcarbamoyltransferase complex ATPase subunit type 1 TsaE, partial [Eubacteriales bacterium]|nr:tRNA (adenosine(37)-N6)-threonylcarbamoyltransferase complex ATPase subunit type 1 TsaE [Eubacteriales bacterium]